MDLTQNTPETVSYMIDAITDKLRMMNIGAIKSTDFNSAMHAELHDIYKLVMKKSSFSPNEMQAIAEELGKLRNM
ncbi:DUF1128 domain-containing protein [Bacillus massiliglaciei]|uniref:DUF1128 domain-containing protein n=1 Tax=Bacillus massiliglaciei TaxID=1816693 RepID=UPI000DA63F1B|nr:DUF1128 domain-containing protein [Bacillus massiliglaciei]